jgi:hypothetical protein
VSVVITVTNLCVPYHFFFEILEWQSDWQLLRKDSAPLSLVSQYCLEISGNLSLPPDSY